MMWSKLYTHTHTTTQAYCFVHSTNNPKKKKKKLHDYRKITRPFFFKFYLYVQYICQILNLSTRLLFAFFSHCLVSHEHTVYIFKLKKTLFFLISLTACIHNIQLYMNLPGSYNWN